MASGRTYATYEPWGEVQKGVGYEFTDTSYASQIAQQRAATHDATRLFREDPQNFHFLERQFDLLAGVAKHGALRNDLERPDLEVLGRRSSAALEQRLAIPSGLDALWGAIKKSYPERVLKIGDYFRHGRLRDAEVRGCLRHAAALHDREKQMQVPQFEPPANLAVRIDGSRHK